MIPRRARNTRRRACTDASAITAARKECSDGNAEKEEDEEVQFQILLVHIGLPSVVIACHIIYVAGNFANAWFQDANFRVRQIMRFQRPNEETRGGDRYGMVR